MTVQHKKRDDSGMFFIEENENRIGLMTYSTVDKNRIIIEHTEVDPEFQGKNYGYELMEAAVQYARESGLKITPVCRFAKVVFDKKKEYSDVLA